DYARWWASHRQELYEMARLPDGTLNGKAPACYAPNVGRADELLRRLLDDVRERLREERRWRKWLKAKIGEATPPAGAGPSRGGAAARGEGVSASLPTLNPPFEHPNMRTVILGRRRVVSRTEKRTRRRPASFQKGSSHVFAPRGVLLP